MRRTGSVLGKRSAISREAIADTTAITGLKSNIARAPRSAAPTDRPGWPAAAAGLSHRRRRHRRARPEPDQIAPRHVHRHSLVGGVGPARMRSWHNPGGW